MNANGSTHDRAGAWREIDRVDPPKRSASERATDFHEIYSLLDEATVRAQASRCIQCPQPSCREGCPLANRIPDWLALAAEGKFLEAAEISQSTSNMPEICSRVCPQEKLCEGSCILVGHAEPICIGAIEKFINEYAFAHGDDLVKAPPANGRRVALVGSGPGSLACADELAKRGYAVTIFDSALVPGGLLVNGTPAFKMERSIIQRRIEILQKRGVVFRLGVKLGESLTFGQLRKGFDAVFLGFDSRKAKPLKIPGADLQGVTQALPFILQKITSVPLDLPPIEVSGKRVLVLGAGDTAMDCLRTAIRYGAHEAICVYRRDEADMPCGLREYKNAREEGARFVFQAAPVAVLGNDQRQVTGLRLVRTELGLMESIGPRPFLIRAGSEFDMGADLVVLALGFDPEPCPHSGDFADLAVNDWGGITVDGSQMTSIPGVFAGGDIVRGPSMVLHAVRDARRAATQIHSYLAARGKAADA